jgi:hypothetical protein
MKHRIRLALAATLSAPLALGAALPAQAASALYSPAQGGPATGFLSTLTGNAFLASSVPFSGPGAGNENPYSLVVAPVSVGKIKKGDVLFDNFNNSDNLQGTGTTIMLYDPRTQAVSVFAHFDQKQAQCAGGIGLTAAMAVLRSGYVVVGSTPSTNGETSTLGQGCLLVANAEGRWVKTINNAKINGPWGNMAVVDKGDSAILFISNVGYGLKGASTKDIKHYETVVRVRFAALSGKAPKVRDITTVGKGFPARSSASAFIKGPTGLALGANGTLYVSNALDNSVNVIPDALTRRAPPAQGQGMGAVLTKGGALKCPLAMVVTSQQTLIVSNALNGQLVEIDSKTGKQLGTYWADSDPAQQPPGNGDLFGLALVPGGKGLYYVQDDNNTLMQAMTK